MDWITEQTRFLYVIQRNRYTLERGTAPPRVKQFAVEVRNGAEIIWLMIEATCSAEAEAIALMEYPS